MADSFVVLDCETTGLGKHDRVVEIAAVVLEGPKLEIVDEFDTLVNPERDTGPVHIHGVTASMVELAPTFSEIAGALADVLHDRVVVAHNLNFDTRMLGYEFSRIEGDFDFGAGVCTLRATNKALPAACEHFSIRSEGEYHRALTDARATAQLLRAAVSSPAGDACRFDLLTAPAITTVRREFVGEEDCGFLCRSLGSMSYPTDDNAEAEYLNMLDWCLDDAVITSEEWAEMTGLANELGLSGQETDELHERYFHALVTNAERDGIITKAENATLSMVANALHISDLVVIPEITEAPAMPDLEKGMGVCFTGSVVVDGEQLKREALEAIADKSGLRPLGSVTKKHCDLLVAADVSSASGKAATARKFGIPVVSVADFLEAASELD